MADNLLQLETEVVNVLKNTYDPEIPVNIYDLGLIYDIGLDDDHIAHITMTLTAPNCPMAEELIEELATNKAQAEEARKKLKSLEAARARLEHQLEFTVKFASKEANEMAELEEGQSDMDTA